MKETIILAPGLNDSELVRCLSLRGVNSINTRIMGSGELARTALMRSGITISKQFIDTDEETVIIAESIKDIEYFGTPSYSDICNIASAIKRMRCLVPTENEAEVLETTLSKGIFREKNNALIAAYKQYMNLIYERNLIDSVMLIREAIASAGIINAEFLVLDEYPLNPLETTLVNKLSDGSVKKVSIKTLFNIVHKPLKIESIKNCYGVSNEVEAIISDIYSNKKADRCTVAVTDPSTYSQLFFDYALIYNIPMTFGCGLPIINSNPGKLLSLYNHWMTDGFFGTDAIMKMIHSDCFDRKKLLETLVLDDVNLSSLFGFLGELKLTNDETINKPRIAEYKNAVAEDAKYVIPGESREYDDLIQKQNCIPILEKIAEELALPIENFILKYSVVRQGDSISEKLMHKLDTSALSSIYEKLKVIQESGISRSDGEAISNVLKTNVMSQRSEPGCVHVTSIAKAISSVRDELYVAGLSSTKYPGSPKENYLLLDSDLMLFGDVAQFMTSSRRISRKREMLLDLVELASGLDANVHLSYSGMDVSELKRDNASSMMFELYRLAHTDNVTAKELEADTIKVEYFEPAISSSRYVGNAYLEKKCILQKDIEYNSPDVVWNINKEYSPTAIEAFFGCPRKFMLSYILGIPEPDETDVFEVISARGSGVLAHSLMELIANTDISLDDFKTVSGEFFDRYIVEHPVLIEDKIAAERDSFLEMMENAYNADPHREVVLKEEDIHCVHTTGVKLHGFPDRVEQLEDGSLLIVDFKTGRNVHHNTDDIRTCLQVVIYAYLMESKGYKVSGGEYRYIRLNKTITCRYDAVMKEKLTEALNMFKTMMESGSFPCGLACEYCKYVVICNKSGEEEVFDPQI